LKTVAQAANSAETAQAGTNNPLLRSVVRFRFALFALLGVMLLAGYNGQWRIGRDSSRYREVARNLVSGKGYRFREHRERHVYPGLAYFLAGVDKSFGTQDPMRPRAALIITTCLGAITLVVIYHLVLAYYPLWIAVCVTIGVGVNAIFLQHCHELMTDLPFLLGICLTLLGIAWLHRPPARRQAAGALIAVAGAALAVCMRPTFFALAIAGAVTCAVQMIRSRRRLWYAGGILALLALLAGWWAIDPRLSRESSVLSGKYEKLALQHLREMKTGEYWRQRAQSIDRTLERHLPQAVVGFQTFRPLGLILSLMLIGGSVLLMRRSLLWGTYVLVTMGMTLALGSVPRYYLMVLPLLLVEYALISDWIAQRLARWPAGVFFATLYCLGFATVVNFGESVDFLLEQHGIRRNLRPSTFLKVYRGGKMEPLVELSKRIRADIPPGQKVLGLEAQIITYLSGRLVYEPREVLDGREQYPWPKILADPELCTWLAKDARFDRMIRDRADYIAVKRRKPWAWRQLSHDKAFWRRVMQDAELSRVLACSPNLWQAVLHDENFRFYVRDPNDPREKQMLDLIRRGCILIDEPSETKVGGMYLGRLRDPAPPPAWQ